MLYDLKAQLNKLRDIKPDEEFILKSRREILSFQKNRFFVLKPFWKEAFSLALGGVILFILTLSIIYFIRPKDTPIASADTLRNELENMPINIALETISYNVAINTTINKTISAITENRGSHIEKTVLEEEASKIEKSSDLKSSDKEINDLLNKVIN